MSPLPKTAALCLLSLAVVAAAAPPASAGTATVKLVVDANLTFPFNEPAYLASCSVAVAAGADGSAVLNAAVGSGCIAGWTSGSFACCGTFVVGIRGHGQSASTDQRNTDSVWPCMSVNPADPQHGKIVSASWVGLVNPPGPAAGTFAGLDAYSAHDGDTLELAYVIDDCAFTNSLAVGVSNVFVGSPVPLAGNAMTDPGQL